MVEHVLCRHRLGLIVRDPREGAIQGDALLAVLQPKVGNHLRRIGRGRPARNGGDKTKRQPQQQGAPRQNENPHTAHRFTHASCRIGIARKLQSEKMRQVIDFVGRGSWIRTNDLQYPKLPRYQAALYPDPMLGNASIHA